MPRGGYRKGKSGTAYANRSDLNQPVQAGPSQGYGQRVAQEDAQRAIPLPAQPPASAGVPGGATRYPDELEPFDRPSDRPGEPITAGLPMGPGPGPDPSLPAFDPVVETLRKAYLVAPNDEIGQLLERLDR